jgi:hypothetical protein
VLELCLCQILEWFKKLNWKRVQFRLLVQLFILMIRF